MRNSFLRTLLNTLFPPHRDTFTAEQYSEDDVYTHFSFTQASTLPAYVCLPYREPSVRTLIKANKFYKSAHAARLLSSALHEALTIYMEEQALDHTWNTPLLIPIPTSPQRVRARGFHQVAHIIEAVPKEMLGTICYTPNVLLRKNRKSQTHIPRSVREQNIKNAFFVPPEHRSLVRGASIIVVDDVLESGATMKDAVRALKDAGAAHVACIALAK